MLPLMQAEFADENVAVERYYEEMSAEKLDELEARARRTTQVLLDFFDITPIAEDNRRGASSQRIQKDILTFGWYVVYSSVRDEDGYIRRRDAYRVIERIRRKMANQKLTMTVDGGGGQKDLLIHFAGINRVRDVPGVAIYQITYTCDANRQF